MKVLIIGGVAAGTKTAAKLKREDRSIEVTVMHKRPGYLICGVRASTLDRVFDSGQGRSDREHAAEIFRADRSGSAYGKEAVALDAEKKVVTVKDVLTGNTEVCPTINW